MDTFWPKLVVELVLLATALIGVAGGVWNRLKLEKGIGVRFLQYLGLVVLVPVIAILAIEHRISQEMTGAVAMAAVAGVLASVGRDEP
jgi:hypothetical protein